jgi:D-glycero-D-manno-heptose 1,7-bisphosphate phosphatase
MAKYLVASDRWARILTQSPPTPRPAVFLDRDGTIIEEREYLAEPKVVALIAGAGELIALARTNGWLTVIFTNQSGIGRGYFGWTDYCAVENRLIELLRTEGAVVDAIFASSALPGRGCDQDSWRKPCPGMILAASRALNIDVPRSVVIGDKGSDMEAGRAAGLSLGIHVATGHGRDQAEAAFALGTERFCVERVESIADAPAVFRAERLWSECSCGEGPRPRGSRA